jgi:hypothetical protein
MTNTLQLAPVSTTEKSFDTGPVLVRGGAWTRIATIGSVGTQYILGVDITVQNSAQIGIVTFPGNAVQLRLTRAALEGEQHGLLQTDLAQVGRNVLMATHSSTDGAGNVGAATGTINQPNPGDTVSLNINNEGCAEIGIEALAVADMACVRICGSAHGGLGY